MTSLLRITGLPDAALDAAAEFYRRWLPRAQAILDEGSDLVLAFPPGDHRHRAWRLAATQGLARNHVPRRCNSLSGGSARAVTAALDYLTQAPGLTGQYLPLDEAGAAPVSIVLKPDADGSCA